MNHLARRVLLELALEDLVAMVRDAVDSNRCGHGRAAAGFDEAALALDRFDALGGFAPLTLGLWANELAGQGKRPAPARYGLLPSAVGQAESVIAARSGALRPPANNRPGMDR